MTDKWGMCNCAQLFEQRRKLWLDGLTGQDRNSISRQITSLLWYAAAFEVVNESRRLAPPPETPGAEPDAVQLSGMLHDLIDFGFVVSQKVGVRRLLDGSSEIDHPKRGVYSLVALLNDMEKHAPLITRKHVFASERLSYDCAALRREFDRIRNQQRASQRAYALPHDLDPSRCEYRHRQIDWFAGVSPEQRSEDDCVRPDVFQSLRTRVETAGQKIKESVNKYVAHAATPESRGAAKADAVTLGDLREAQRAIGEVANFLSIDVLGGPQLGFLPIPQFDQFEYIDRPLVKASAIPHLRDVWDQFEQQVHGWGHWSPDGFPLPGR